MKPPKDYFTTKMRDKGLRYSIYEGVFATLMTSVTTASFISAFALVLGANDLEIGLISSLPLVLWTLAQIPAARIVETTGKRRRIAYICALFSRTLWLPLMLIPIFMFTNSITLLIVLLAISSFFGAIIGPAWASWMGDMVPVERRGAYFGKRNTILSIFTLMATIFAGLLLDFFPKNDTTGFMILFFVGGVTGIGSAIVLKMTPEPPFKRVERKESFREELSKVLSNKRLKIFLIIFFLWNFAVSIASPFFVVRLVRDIGADYIWVSIEIIIATFFSILTFKYWGTFADRFGNKVIIGITAFGASFVPFLYIMVKQPWHIIPVEVVSGIAWAGFNLAIFNYLLELSPEERRPIFSALFWVVMGISGIAGPIIGGLLAETYAHSYFLIFTGLEVTFFVSWALRITAAFLFLYALKEVETRVKVETGYVLGEMIKIRAGDKLHNFHFTRRSGVKPIVMSGYGVKKSMKHMSNSLEDIKKAGIKVSDTKPGTTSKFFKALDETQKTTVEVANSIPKNIRIEEDSELHGDALKIKEEVKKTKDELKQHVQKIRAREEPMKEKDVKKLTEEMYKINKRVGKLRYDMRKFHYHYKKRR